VPCTCTERRLEDEREVRLQRYSNLGPLVRMTFEGLSSRGRSSLAANQQQFARVIEAARAFAADPQGWLVLTGSPGAGKTHIAAAVANQRIAQGHPVLFAVVPDLLDHLRSAFAPTSGETYDELFEQVRNAPLLVLDDLGTHSSTPWAQEKLFQLLNHRYNTRLPTVITTAASLDALGYLRHRITDPAIAQVWALEQHEETLFQYQGSLGMDLLRQMNFRSFDTSGMNASRTQQESLKAAYDAALRFAEQPQDWLVFTGPLGCGKTHLAAAVANYQLQQGHPVFFVVVPDLLDHLRSTFAPDSAVTYDTLFDSIRNTSLLVMDDLGIQSASPWAQEKLFQLINHRYNGRLPTVITTSLDATQLADYAPAVTSRLRDPRISTMIAIDAPDFRTGDAARPLVRSGGGPVRSQRRRG
jgi:DNA replication protein DnaC